MIPSIKSRKPKTRAIVGTFYVLAPIIHSNFSTYIEMTVVLGRSAAVFFVISSSYP